MRVKAILLFCGALFAAVLADVHHSFHGPGLSESLPRDFRHYHNGFHDGYLENLFDSHGKDNSNSPSHAIHSGHNTGLHRRYLPDASAYHTTQRFKRQPDMWATLVDEANKVYAVWGAHSNNRPVDIGEFKDRIFKEVYEWLEQPSRPTLQEIKFAHMRHQNPAPGQRQVNKRVLLTIQQAYYPDIATGAAAAWNDWKSQSHSSPVTIELFKSQVYSTAGRLPADAEERDKEIMDQLVKSAERGGNGVMKDENQHWIMLALKQTYGPHSVLPSRPKEVPHPEPPSQPGSSQPGPSQPGPARPAPVGLGISGVEMPHF